jgi:N-acetylglucosaminyldiphosphoundecaprenol N-acetyl-beta-D-mannosaminyltransferase
MAIIEFPTYQFLGVKVQPLTKAELLGVFDVIMASDLENCIVGNHNLHSLYLVHREQAMRDFYGRALYTHVDGISIILLAKLLRVPLRRTHRNGYLDWIVDFLRMAAERSWRIYFLGGPPEMSESVPARLGLLFPGLQVRSHHGFDAFTPDTTVWEEIEEFGPQIILVGMGMPRQERWILEATTRIHSRLLLPCGATVEYLMHFQKPAPRWLGPIGLEWLYRLVTRPRSLYRRYLLEPLTLIPIILREMITRKAQDD